MKRKKLSAFAITVLSIALISILYAYTSDNRNIEKIPGEVITLEFEFTNIFLIPVNNGYIIIDNA